MSGKNSFSNDECPGPGVISGGFAAGSNSAVIQKARLSMTEASVEIDGLEGRVGHGC